MYAFWRDSTVRSSERSDATKLYSKVPRDIPPYRFLKKSKPPSSRYLFNPLSRRHTQAHTGTHIHAHRTSTMTKFSGETITDIISTLNDVEKYKKATNDKLNAYHQLLISYGTSAEMNWTEKLANNNSLKKARDNLTTRAERANKTFEKSVSDAHAAADKDEDEERVRLVNELKDLRAEKQSTAKKLSSLTVEFKIASEKKKDVEHTLRSLNEGITEKKKQTGLLSKKQNKIKDDISAQHHRVLLRNINTYKKNYARIVDGVVKIEERKAIKRNKNNFRLIEVAYDEYKSNWTKLESAVNKSNRIIKTQDNKYELPDLENIGCITQVPSYDPAMDETLHCIFIPVLALSSTPCRPVSVAKEVPPHLLLGPVAQPVVMNVHVPPAPTKRPVPAEEVSEGAILSTNHLSLGVPVSTDLVIGESNETVPVPIEEPMALSILSTGEDILPGCQVRAPSISRSFFRHNFTSHDVCHTGTPRYR